MSDTADDLILGPEPITFAHVESMILHLKCQISSREKAIAYLTGIQDRIIRDNQGPGHPPGKYDPRFHKGDPNWTLTSSTTPTIVQRMNKCLGESSYDNPILEKSGWKLFAQDGGFIPSASDLTLTATLLMRASTDDKDRCYVTCVGISRVFCFPENNDFTITEENCPITKAAYLTSGNKWLKAEIAKSIDLLVAFVSEKENLQDKEVKS